MNNVVVHTINIGVHSLQTHADWSEDNDCYLKFEGLMMKMICKTDLNYRKYVLTSKTTGKEKPYGKLTKAVYGNLLRAILFYKKLSR